MSTRSTKKDLVNCLTDECPICGGKLIIKCYAKFEWIICSICAYSEQEDEELDEPTRTRFPIYTW